MSHSPEVKEDPVECPLCMEPLEIDDINFFPCTCGYQICRFCWHRIRTDENGLCPACRKPYPEDPAVYKPLSQEELQRIKNEKKQKQNERKQKISENRKHLASVRVVQRNLVFVVGLSQRLADPEVLKRPEYFGKFGKIHKVVINNSTSYAGSQGPSASAYVTYIRSEDALRAIQCVNNVVVDGRTLKVSSAVYECHNKQVFMPWDLECPHYSRCKAHSLFLSLCVSLSHCIPSFDSPSPPPGLSKPSLVVPLSASNHSARSPFEGAAAESQSLFSDNSNFRHPNPIPSGLAPFPSSPQNNTDWPTAPEPHSLFTSETIPVSSSTDWQAAFGFGSSKHQEDDLGFDPFDITRKALADLIEKELSVQDQSPLSPGSLHNPLHGPSVNGLGAGFMHSTAAPSNANFPNSVLPPRFPQFQHRAMYNSFSFPGQPARYPWMGVPRNNVMHLNHTANPTSNSHFLDLSLLPQHSTGLGGISITGKLNSNTATFFGGIHLYYIASEICGTRHIVFVVSWHFRHRAPASSGGISHSLSWDGSGSWMDPAIITGVPSSSGNGVDSLQDDNPPHWLKSLQALTEMDSPSATVPLQPPHSTPFSTQVPLHRAGWAPYPPPSNPTSFHSPPPGFQTAFRNPSQTPTDLIQSAAMDRH
ncbi:CNOT4 protein, partial [Polyodon spathula]|nr:CNOT4 protein [Polyodon spathula]